MTDFSSLGIDPKLLEAIDALGFQSPTDVQQKAVPILLEKETDIVVLAQTGTGKTAAFGLPMLQKIDTNSLSLIVDACSTIYGDYIQAFNG